MEGFRYHYERAFRVHNNVEWSEYSLNYGLFKKRLLHFRQRRGQIKAYLRNSAGGTIPESTLSSIIGPRLHHPDPELSEKEQATSIPNYIPFVDEESSSSADGVPSHVITSPEGQKYEGSEKQYKKRSVLRRISNTERSEVTLYLNNEMDKVSSFYMTVWQHLSQDLEERGPTLHLGNEILELLAHCTLNVIALRQSLIRYDAFVRTYGGTPMLVWYMKKMKKHKNSIKKIMFHEELNALMDTFVRECTFELSDFHSQWDMLKDVLLETEKKEVLASLGQRALRDSFVHALRHYFLLGAIEDRMLTLEPTFLTQRGTSLSAEMQRLSDWRHKPKSFHSTSDVSSSTSSLSMYEKFALALNIISSFFYCMNYYIVEPTSTMYVNALGAPDYFSATLIGMMPLAALSSAVGYAVWTNYAFRPPLIASSLMLMCGNIIYASALKYQSVWIALAGRFMTGLGAPKCIIRRYMADTTPVAMRTSVNAYFALSIAVGSALGPAMAIVLDRFDFFTYLPGYGVIIVNGMTGPGYFMAAVWATYALIIVITFKEPDRAGLEEQRQMEMEQANARMDPIDPSDSTVTSTPHRRKRDDDLSTIFSGDGYDASDQTVRSIPVFTPQTSYWTRLKYFADRITPPVRLCLGLLFAKTFTIESLVSCTSVLTKNRYQWKVSQVGMLGCINGLLVVPLSISVGYLSMYYQDRMLMVWLVSVSCVGIFMLIDVTDLMGTPTESYNEGMMLAVNPARYVAGYFLSYICIQSFEGVIGSSLSKVIPTSLASGTFNSGLLATLVDTLGRATGDLFISLMGWVNLRQLMNLLFIPAFLVLLLCLFTIRKYYDLLAV
mmetsp:Transcript_10719/g.16432  ORF Transcript_10719/g.16432 Transcript_10719/m.16432 type:complete len:836 (+) Transcript_10719:172-2679(+)